MSKLKIVFHVEDENKNIVVEKSQLVLLLGDDPCKMVTKAQLGVDYMKEMPAALRRAADAAPDEAVKIIESIQEMDKRREVIDEYMLAIGDIIQRYIRNKLLAWASSATSQPSPVPLMREMEIGELDGDDKPKAPAPGED